MLAAKPNPCQFGKPHFMVRLAAEAGASNGTGRLTRRGRPHVRVRSDVGAAHTRRSGSGSGPNGLALLEEGRHALPGVVGVMHDVARHLLHDDQ